MAKNYKGEELFDKPRKLTDVKFGSGRIGAFGPEVNWNLVTQCNNNADEDGFDIRYEISECVLPAGTKIIRYGNEIGRYTAPIGTTYEMLSLPYVKETIEYHEYNVVEPTKVKCEVSKGIVASAFGQVGGGVQYKHQKSIAKLLEEGVLKEDASWIEKMN